jgi:hypothetical protein
MSRRSALAAAYAEAGNFQKAVEWETKALALLAGREEVELQPHKTALKLYEQGKPFRR